MTSTLTTILGPEGSIARRLGEKYEHRPQQLKMAAAAEEAFLGPRHLLVEAGSGRGEGSFGQPDGRVSCYSSLMDFKRPGEHPCPGNGKTILKLVADAKAGKRLEF